MPGPLEKKNIVLGVCGSIACHKSVDLASKLTQSGALVDVMMTQSALAFVTPLAFESITHRPVVQEMFDSISRGSIEHIAAAEKADLIVIAPATANTIAKLALGLSDNPLTTTAMATQAPILICPAMDGNMYSHPATQDNIRILESRGCSIAGPSKGHLASGLIGTGRLLETDEIIGHMKLILGRNRDLAGRKIVVSAGGTQEAIDPVRFISNRSSGKMGYAVAEAARDRGADTMIVSAPNSLICPIGVRITPVSSAEEMMSAVCDETPDADALIMAAAVADWRPIKTLESKIKKGSSEKMSVSLTRTPDVLESISPDNLVKVGFAAETENLESNARSKLFAKGLDLIVANDVTVDGSGFGSDSNEVVFIDQENGIEEFGLMTKYDVGHRILDRVACMFSDKES